MIIVIRKKELTHYGVPGMRWGKRKARWQAHYADKFQRRADRKLKKMKRLADDDKHMGTNNLGSKKYKRLAASQALNTVRANYYKQGLTKDQMQDARLRFRSGQLMRWTGIGGIYGMRVGRGTLPARYFANKRAQALSGGLKRPTKKTYTDTKYDRFRKYTSSNAIDKNRLNERFKKQGRTRMLLRS